MPTHGLLIHLFRVSMHGRTQQTGPQYVSVYAPVTGYGCTSRNKERCSAITSAVHMQPNLYVYTTTVMEWKFA